MREQHNIHRKVSQKNRSKPMNILYLSNVPWGWIKQRPQFLAEELSCYYKIDVCFRKSYSSKTNTFNKAGTDGNIRELFKFPFENIPIIYYLNKFLIKQQLRSTLNHYNLIWVADPLTFSAVHGLVSSKQLVIYDCMDDLLAFPRIKQRVFLLEKIKLAEKILIERANVILTSSCYLTQVLCLRFSFYTNLLAKIHIINNATDDHITKMGKNHAKSPLDEPSALHDIVYIGTISEWFDFTLVINHLKYRSDIRYVLYGPLMVQLPKYERLIYGGIVDHNNLSKIMQTSDVLVMPFIRSEIVLSVDPVKAYEYICSTRPTVLLSYEETQKFAEYAFLYQNAEEYVKIIDDILDNGVHKELLNLNHFLRANQWSCRARDIVKIIDSLQSENN